MAEDNVTSLGAVRADKNADSRHWTAVECLEEAIRMVKAGEFKQKVIVVSLDTDDDSFTIDFLAAHISASQVVALSECLKARILAHMGYL